MQKPLKTRVNSKYQRKGSTYILHLLASVEIRLFNVFFWERKAGFGKLMKNLRDAGFSRKRGGNAGSGPPFQTVVKESSHSVFTLIVTPLVFQTALTQLLMCWLRRNSLEEMSNYISAPQHFFFFQRDDSISKNRYRLTVDVLICLHLSEWQICIFWPLATAMLVSTLRVSTNYVFSDVIKCTRCEDYNVCYKVHWRLVSLALESVSDSQAGLRFTPLKLKPSKWSDIWNASYIELRIWNADLYSIAFITAMIIAHSSCL